MKAGDQRGETSLWFLAAEVKYCSFEHNWLLWLLVTTDDKTFPDDVSRDQETEQVAGQVVGGRVDTL